MNEIFPDNSIPNRNLIRHLGSCLYELERNDESYPFLIIYIKLTKATKKQVNKKKLAKYICILECTTIKNI